MRSPPPRLLDPVAILVALIVVAVHVAAVALAASSSGSAIS
jgi:hypothetical protein